jgi:2-polyprenyl-3-methyl-5-hydroxy-6-metoxy-1,4-benzoquinol methylase
MQETSEPYNNYVAWKGWQPDLPIPLHTIAYYEAEIPDYLRRPRTRLLEIGFGSGTFLDWARSQDLEVTGLEIIQPLVEQAASRGHRVFNYDLSSKEDQPPPFSNDLFDGIIAFDVFEHLDTDSIAYSLKRLSPHLSESGIILLRFPNGDSPFSLHFQNGDYTHKTWLNRSKLEQICLSGGFEVLSYRNSKRVTKGLSLRPLRSLIFCIRNAIELAVGYIYYSKRLPLDPNATAILRKTAAK